MPRLIRCNQINLKISGGGLGGCFGFFGSLPRLSRLPMAISLEMNGCGSGHPLRARCKRFCGAETTMTSIAVNGGVDPPANNLRRRFKIHCRAINCHTNLREFIPSARLLYSRQIESWMPRHCRMRRPRDRRRCRPHFPPHRRRP